MDRSFYMYIVSVVWTIQVEIQFAEAFWKFDWPHL
jgi:hypothetical protein